MGVGNVGSFIAHSLRDIPNVPPVTLLFSTWERLNAWKQSPQKLTLITDGDAEERGGFDAEVAIPRVRIHGKEVGLKPDARNPADPQALSGESTEPISSLVICSKAPFVLQGLSAVKHRLRADSVVLFMMNGMGTVEEVNREIFPDPATRPYYMVGINSHGVHNLAGRPFTTVHAGFGTISLGILPHERDRTPDAPYTPDIRFTPQGPKPTKPPEKLNPDYAPPESTFKDWTPNQRHLLRSLLRAPVLSAAPFSPPDILQIQLEKLAVNCIINPLTVLLDARNGSILYNYSLTRIIRLLLSEISLVIRSLPELQYIPNVSQRFDPGRLESKVVSVATATADNISSMLADARAGKHTEIEYINGWVVRKGEELGIRPVCNYMMVNLVKGKSNLIGREGEDYVPLVESKERERDVRIVGGQAVRREEGEDVDGRV